MTEGLPPHYLIYFIKKFTGAAIMAGNELNVGSTFRMAPNRWAESYFKLNQGDHVKACPKRVLFLFGSIKYYIYCKDERSSIRCPMTSLGFSEDQLDESCAEVTKRHAHSNSRATNRLTRDNSFSRDRENDKMSLFKEIKSATWEDRFTAVQPLEGETPFIAV